MDGPGRVDGGTPPAAPAVPFHTAVRAWFLISLQTFGGPAGQIAVMHRSLVDERRWIGEKRFLHALNYCMLLPGPEAHQLAVYSGWLLHGTRGGIVAGTLFVLPGAVALLVLSAVYVAFGSTVAVSSLFAGLAPAVLAIVAQALRRIATRALVRPALVGVAVLAFVALAAFAVPFPLVIALAAVAGWALGRWRPVPEQPSSVDEPDAPLPRPGSRLRAARVAAVGLVAWGLPLLAFAVLTGPDSVFTTMGTFFSGAAVVTFGGAYAVLAYVAQRAVEVYGWLTPGEMVRGLALAETTPGPLIMVVQFVAFVGAYRDPGGLDPWVAAVLAALLVTWVTFVPSFVFVLLGAPAIERLRGNRTLTSALTGVTAAVVGVIANLAVYFAVATLFADSRSIEWGPLSLLLPEPTSVRWFALTVAAAAGVALLRLRVGVLTTLGLCAVAGLLAGLAGVPVG